MSDESYASDKEMDQHLEILRLHEDLTRTREQLEQYKLATLQWQETAKNLYGELKAMNQGLEIAREALEFYADPHSWRWNDEHCDYSSIRLGMDSEWTYNGNEKAADHYEGTDKMGGKRARAALEKLAEHTQSNTPMPMGEEWQ